MKHDPEPWMFSAYWRNSAHSRHTALGILEERCTQQALNTHGVPAWPQELG